MPRIKKQRSVPVKLFLWFLAFTVSLLGARHKRDNLENKPSSLLFVFLGKAVKFSQLAPSILRELIILLSSDISAVTHYIFYADPVVAIN